MAKRQPRTAKKFLVVESEAEKILRLVPSSRVPRLKYHGVDPDHLVGFDIDVYLPTGERKAKGRLYKYKSTYFTREE